MTYVAIISRISQCVPNASDWWTKRKSGQPVLLMREDDNPVAPDQAVAAYIDNEKCGYVRSADLPVIRVTIGTNDGIGVRLEDFSPDADCLYVGLEIDDQLQLQPYQPRLTIQPVAGISLPHLDLARELKMDQVMDLCAYLDNANQLIASDQLQNDLWENAGWLSENFGQSLSGDDYRTMQQLLDTITLLKEELDGFDMLDEEVETLQSTYQHLSNDSLKVWKSEFKQAEHTLKAKNGFLSEITMLLQQGTISREKMLSDLSAWLLRLPHNLFQLWSAKPSLFAQRLFYERFSTCELDAIKTYLITYSYVRDWGSKDKSENWGAVLFPHTIDNYQRANIVRAMQQFMEKPYSTPQLAHKIRALVARGELNSPLEGNFSLYCRALKAYFGLTFDDANLRKALRTT